MFRARTTRGNIRYRVVTVRAADQREEAVRREVTRRLQQASQGRVIVSSATVQQAGQLGESLSCPVYHSTVDTVAGKVKRMMRGWERRVIVATNALGFGIDMPDVRLVVHAGVPRRLRAYAQESERGGRDGMAGEAVVIRMTGEGEKRAGEEACVYDEGMQAFIGGRECRRVVSDRVTVGRGGLGVWRARPCVMCVRRRQRRPC